MAELAESEIVWLERSLYDDLEIEYHSNLHKVKPGEKPEAKALPAKCTETTCKTQVKQEDKTPIAGEIAKAREHIRHTLNGLDTNNSFAIGKIDEVLKVNETLNKRVSDLEKLVEGLTKRIVALETSQPSHTLSSQEEVAPTEDLKEEMEEEKDEDDFELFGSEGEGDDEEAERIKQERLKAYEEKKSKKPQLVAKSNIILDVKPWDDETDMVELEKCVRSIEMDGLLWGASKLIPLAYGIRKLQISCVVEDDKVSTEDLEEQIVAFEDHIQSMDIAAFNKV